MKTRMLLLALLLLPTSGALAQNFDNAWWVIVGSTPNPNNAVGPGPTEQHRRITARVAPCGFDIYTDFSANWANFTPGYNAHVIGPHDTQAEANAVLQGVRACVPDAYIKRSSYAAKR